jgi:hypothetical protein
MKTILYLSSIIVVLLFVSCNKDQVANDNAIEIIKQSKAAYEDVTWENFLTRAAGLEGNIKWKAFTLDENNPELKVVELNIIKNHKGVVDTLQIQWKVNNKTRFSKLSYFTISRKPQSLYLGMFTLECWITEN